VKAERERSAGAFAGIGVHIEAKVDADGNAIMSANAEDGPLINSDDKGRPLIKEVMPNGPAMQAGMKDGDAIVSINGEPFKDAAMKTVMEKMRGQAGETVEIVVARGKKQVTLKIVRGIVKTEVVSSQMLTADNGTQVGYIRLEHFGERDAADEMAAAITKLDSADRLIIDLRFNPGGDVEVCLKLASLFIKEGTLVSIRERNPGSGHKVNTITIDADGMNIESKDEVTGRIYRQANKRMAALAGDKKIVILVNGRSASASEMFTGALQDNKRATVVGETTFGKGIGQSVMPMPNGTSLHITSLRYFTPSGKWLGDGGNSAEKHGIEPDHKITLVQKPGLKLGSPNDNQLSFALQLIAR
jgi:carboxyl-terminal processing protease